MTVLTLRATKGSPLTHNEVDDNFRNVHEKLAAPRTYYVATDGDDDNDGLTEGAPFLTIQAAIDAVAGLDLDHQHRVTVQLAAGTYHYSITGSLAGIRFNDPLNAVLPVSAESFFQFNDGCLLRGDPANPESVIISHADFTTLTFQRSTAWRVSGVRVQNDNPSVALITAADHGRGYLDTVDFHFSQDGQVGVLAGTSSHIETGPVDELTHCTISKSGGVTTVVNLFYATGGGYIKSTGDIDCQSVALEITDAWTKAETGGYVFDYNNYLNAENITGKRFEALRGSAISFRRLTAFAGDEEGWVDASSALQPNNNDLSISGETFPVIDPIGGLLADQLNDRTISNQFASAMVHYELPGADDIHYLIGPHKFSSEVYGPLGYRFSFVVQDASGIRISPQGGLNINVAGTVAGKIESTTIGSVITLLNINTHEWMATSQLGTWTTTAPIANSVIPACTPTLSAVSGTVSVDAGTWATTPAQVFYQWYHISVVDPFPVDAIYHATTNTLVIPADIPGGDAVACIVSMIDTAGVGSEPVFSDFCFIVG